MSGTPDSRDGFTVAGVVLVLSMACFVAALVWPVVVRGDFEDRVEEVSGAVVAAREAMRAHREAEGRWPAPTDPGQVTVELDRYLPPGSELEGEGWRLRVRGWQTLEPPAARPPVAVPVDPATPPGEPPTEAEPPSASVVPLAGLSVHSPEPALLAALLAEFGTARSFVRDTVWTLVLPRAGTTGGS